MKLLKLLFPLSLFLLFAGVQCKKGKEPVIPVYIPQELKDYMYFLPGTYWVYEDSATGDLDSVYVTDAKNEIDTVYDDKGNIENIWEWFKVWTVSDYDGYDYRYYCHSSFNGDCNPNTKNCFKVKRIKLKEGDYAGNPNMLLYPFIVGNWLYSNGTGSLKVKDVSDSIDVNGMYFDNVVIMNDTDNINENKQETDFYIAKNIGIIRKELIEDKKVWNLIRYHIVQ